MRKIVVLLSLAIMATSALAQTIQEKKQIRALESEIRKIKRDVAILDNKLSFDYSEQIAALNSRNVVLVKMISVEKDSVRRAKLEDSISINKEAAARLAYRSISVDRKDIQYDIEAKKNKIADLEKERDNIFFRYATSRAVPAELSPRELRRRQRANILRREDLVLEKIEANISNSSSSASISPSKSSVSNAGYKVIVANDYPLTATFIITSIDGGDSKSVVLESSKRTDIYLLPGKYVVSTLIGGRQSGLERVMTVDGRVDIFKGETCFNFIYKDRQN